MPANRLGVNHAVMILWHFALFLIISEGYKYMYVLISSENQKTFSNHATSSKVPQIRNCHEMIFHPGA